jgi:glycosyltransferase involved in cell wall biosynthesis
LNFAVCTVAYNEAEWIRACILQFKPWIDRHVVLVSSQPWFGAARRDDGTAQLAIDNGAEVHVKHWQDEAEQRNWGLTLLADFDYVLIVDADELYSPAAIKETLAVIDRDQDSYFRVAEMRTYWKTTDYVCAPPETWEAPIIAVDPQRARFRLHRQVELLSGDRPAAGKVPVTLHHMSWVKSDAKVREKVETFSHAMDIRPGWYENVWLKWTPETTEIGDMSPYGRGEMYVVRCPCPALDE